MHFDFRELTSQSHRMTHQCWRSQSQSRPVALSKAAWLNGISRALCSLHLQLVQLFFTWSLACCWLAASSSVLHASRSPPDTVPCLIVITLDPTHFQSVRPNFILHPQECYVTVLHAHDSLPVEKVFRGFRVDHQHHFHCKPKITHNRRDSFRL